MRPRDLLVEIKALGYRLDLRPGGLRLQGPSQPQASLLNLIQENREGLLSFLEGDARAVASHMASLIAGRVTTFPEYLMHLVPPPVPQWGADGKAAPSAHQRLEVTPRPP